MADESLTAGSTIRTQEILAERQYASAPVF